MSKPVHVTTRVHRLKEQLQKVAEQKLSEASRALELAQEELRETTSRWQSSLGGPVDESVAQLQYRTAYADVLQRRMATNKQQVHMAQFQLDENRRAVRLANVETEQWAYLANQVQTQEVRQREHKNQVDADDLASGRWIIGHEGGAADDGSHSR